MRKGGLIWCEDDVTHNCEGHEDIVAAYHRLFDADWNTEERMESEDCGDHFYYRTRHAVICMSYDGYSIHKLPRADHVDR